MLLFSVIIIYALPVGPYTASRTLLNLIQFNSLLTSLVFILLVQFTT